MDPIYLDGTGWYFDRGAGVREYMPAEILTEAQARIYAATGDILTDAEAMMALNNPTTEWQEKAESLLARLRAMLTEANEINEFFAANDVLAAITASLGEDQTGAGIVEGTTYTAARAVALMALMADIEAFLAGDLTPIQGLPVPEISRRVAIRRTK